MPRSSSPTLENLLPGCETQSTIDITLRDDTHRYFWTGDEEIELDGQTYESFLKKIGELRQTVGEAVNRVQATISNVDRVFGLIVAANSRKTELTDVIVRRLYQDLEDAEIFEHRHFFTGKAANSEVNEQFVLLDVISDLTAAGTCIATETLTPTNGWVFPETPEPSPPGTETNPIRRFGKYYPVDINL